jgi:myo-inositol-1(or 4)-monophosphatase
VTDALHRELLELAQEAARRAGELLRDGRPADLAVAATKSSPIDVVTEMDIAAEKLITDLISARRPDDGFLGEEGGSSSSSTGVVWVVDPIDGTVNFLYDIPQYAVSVAATVDGRSVAGVVVDVAGGETFTATLGGGARRGDVPLSLEGPGTPPLSKRLVGTGFNYVTDVKVRQAEAVARMLHEVRDIRRMGSAALDLCAVAAGRLDGYVEEGLNAWDMAAGGLVATEAGALLERRAGVGGKDCYLCAPAAGFPEFRDLVERCGFLDPEDGNRPGNSDV